jgi:phospholipid/cholesterol/gamma-HCH transport system substrate-binding protein
MNQRTATIKVGLLTILSCVVLITTVIWLRGRTLAGGQNFEIDFRDVDGLRQGAPVQFMGIRVGFVDTVTPIQIDHKVYKAYRVKVKFTVTETDIHIPKGSFISLEQSGIIGEKFIEITPPRPQNYELTLQKPEPSLQKGTPIMVRFREGIVPVGEVMNADLTKDTKVLKTTPDYIYDIRYKINRPGYLPPNETMFWVKHRGRQTVLLLDDDSVRWQAAPPEDTYFTREEPMRLKEFLEQQLASAEALKTTNEKINKLLSDEAITSIQGTLKNSEQLTAQATQVLIEAHSLLASSTADLKTLVVSTKELTENVVAVSHNVNDVIGNPKLKAEIQKTVASVDTSSAALASILNDPNLKGILADTKVTSQNAAELVQYLKAATVNNDLEGRINDSLTLLNSSLTKLSTVMENIQAVSDDKDSLKEIIKNTKETSENLNQFSQRINKHFALIRMLF